jgi:uncharacterized protein (UPF0303 family)
MNADNLNRESTSLASKSRANARPFRRRRCLASGRIVEARAESKGQAVLIEIRIAGRTVFCYAMPGTAPTNAD